MTRNDVVAAVRDEVQRRHKGKPVPPALAAAVQEIADDVIARLRATRPDEVPAGRLQVVRHPTRDKQVIMRWRTPS